MEKTSLPATTGQSANALKHGIRATDELLVPNLQNEEKDAFEAIRTLIVHQYQPADQNPGGWRYSSLGW